MTREAFYSSPCSSKNQDETPVTSPVYEHAPAVQPVNSVNGNLADFANGPGNLQPVGNARLSDRFSTENGTTRYALVRLGEVWERVAEHALQPVVDRTPYMKAHRVKLSSRSYAFKFDSLSDAERAVRPSDPQTARHTEDLLGPGEFLHVPEWVRLVGAAESRPVVFPSEGQVVLEITTTEGLTDDDVAHSYYAALEFLDEHLGRNQVRAFMRLPDPASNVFSNAFGRGFRYRLEVDQLRVAAELKAEHQGTRIGKTKWTINVIDYNPAGSQAVHNTALVSQGFTRPRPACTAMIPRRGGRNTEENSANAINLDNIRDGIDVRTTVMLRNIPNKMDTYQLEDLLQKLAFGRFDFVYLRIDFRNGLNVGYAFVNFVAAMDIVRFCERLVAHGWPCDLGSGKNPAVSYATVQGVEALVEKFRNSSVMLEMHPCRPRLFHTRDSAFRFLENAGVEYFETIGNELDFPPPNNDAKLQRSRQNAETQGLWPAHTREDQRRARHTTFDRGNPNANVDTRSVTASATPATTALTIRTDGLQASSGFASSSSTLGSAMRTPQTGDSSLTGGFPSGLLSLSSFHSGGQLARYGGQRQNPTGGHNGDYRDQSGGLPRFGPNRGF